MFAMVIPVISKLLDTLIPDAKVAQQLKVKMLDLEFQKQFKESEQEFFKSLKQLEVNAVEAASNSLFVAGWRPAVGWICVVALGYHYVLAPFIDGILQAFHIDVTLTQLNIADLMTILCGMLGLGAFRTAEKISFNKQKFYEVLRDKTKSLNTKDVQMLEEAIDKSIEKSSP
jgi:hypothetical protein